MTIPVWILDSFAGLMLAVAAVSAARLAVARPWPRGGADAEIDVAHLLMAIAMAGTLAAGLRTLPDAAWEAIFGLLIAWFSYRVVREVRGRGRLLANGHHLPHLVHSVAMLYMFLALTAPGAGGGTAIRGMAASSGPVLRLPTLALAFAFVLLGLAVSDLDRLSLPAALPRSRPARASRVPAGVALVGARAMAASTRSAGTLAASAGITVSAGSAGSSGTPSTAGSALTMTTPPPPSAETPPAMAAHRLTPGVTRGGRIAMGVTMAFMLITMISPPA